jgi:hypothetical protein
LEDAELYMNCGIEPLSEDIRISATDYMGNKGGIKLKAKKIPHVSILHKLMAVESPVHNQ